MSDAKYKALLVDEEAEVDAAVPAFPKKAQTPSAAAAASWIKPVCKFLLLLSLAVAIVFGIVAGFTFYMGQHVMHKVAQVVVPQVTTDQPLHLPQVHLEHGELHQLKHNLRDFHHALHHGRTPEKDLLLTERDINGLICASNKKMCGHAYAKIAQDKIEVEYSIPADDVPGGKGRYFVGTKALDIVSSDENAGVYDMHGRVSTLGPNGEFTLLDSTWNMDLENASVEITSAEIMGWVATDSFVERFFKGKNWAEHMCHHARESMQHIEGLSITDDKIVVHVK